MTERGLRAVPRPVAVGLAAALAAQVWLSVQTPPRPLHSEDLSAPPTAAMVRLLSGGDVVPAAHALMLYLQAFDRRADNRIAYQALEYGQLIGWLDLILTLDPAGQYPLHAASRLYAEVPDPVRQRSMLEFIYGKFLEDPDRRWPWLAHAAAVAKHRLKDLPLARRFAAAIQRHATGTHVPTWARQMEAFILEDMNELETARLLIGGYVKSGQVTDQGELRFLERRLEEISARVESQRRSAKPGERPGSAPPSKAPGAR